MPLRKHINPHSVQNPDTGFGNDPSTYGGRFLNKDGSFNIIRKGVFLRHRISIFQKMIAMSTLQFLLTISLFYLGINLIFAGFYYLPRIDEFTGLHDKTNSIAHFIHLFFFSAQTLTTVGYGHISPTGFWANLIASFEALCGLMTFAIMTGLVYSRFARPRSFLIFSRNALIAPYRGQTGLMFRLVSYKDSHNLIDTTIKVNLSLMIEENGEQKYKFFSLPLERYRIDSLSMNWTVVHPIDEKSPLQNFSKEDLEHAQAEFFVQITGFDEVYSSKVVQKTSYYFNEIIYNAKFRPMYHENDRQTSTILELDKLNEFEVIQSEDKFREPVTAQESN